MKDHRRNIFRHLNEHQERVLLPFFVVCLIALACVLFLALIDNPIFKDTDSYRNIFRSPINILHIAKAGLAIIITAGFFVLIYWAYYAANKVLGAYARVLNELDEIILSKRKGPIKVREGDDFFKEMLERINIFIETRKEVRERMIDRILKNKMNLKSCKPKDFFWRNS